LFDRRLIVKRFLVVFGLFIMFVGVTVASASHTSTTIRPITGLEKFHIYEYPRLATAVNCGANELVGFGAVRVEINVRLAPDPSDSPSEHFDVRLSFEGPDGNIWGGLWPHQNIPAHHRAGGLEILSFNHWKLTPGQYKATVRVTGQESGDRLEESCDWTQAGATEPPPRSR